ncbi:excalibur calcium-binding domain-containing protein [Aestuariibacter sp. P117]|uniref:Excalibur calcium-binding domain-containing protein n=1 Tax=Glaciecola petra TaxID=3075602 RepID=A0ABU2ZVP1_9ALTE|nr:excalibur calcium-binding domain-containing protein [Aestuariibacter sp. P117]MDT0596680.1 excalibur calcium-binding domain-containing protein [Aestuariibacter sp. P117]
MKIKHFFVSGLLVVGALALFSKVSVEPTPSVVNPSLPIEKKEAVFIQADKFNFKCDGRQHCSEMTSLEEARFFLKHCPDTKMDGDNDGEPCERQF